MAKRQIVGEAAGDVDPLHPRRTLTLAGHAKALSIVSRAIRGGRPPQGWLFCGPPGIGKATLAYRVARYLLTYGASAAGPEDLSVSEDAETARLVAGGAHPGLLVLSRGINPDTGKPMTVLSVEEVRKLGPFFGMTSGAGGWRIVLIDTADDMNDAAANALLKLLEEPPARSMLLLVSHAPGRMLPTIRSRCQRLNLRPLSHYEMETELHRLLPDFPAEECETLARLSAGSPGAAMRLSSGDGLMLAKEADRLIDTADNPDFAALLRLMEKVVRMTDGTAQLGEFLRQALAARIRARALAGSTDLYRWVETLERIHRSCARTEALHLDPKQTMLGAAGTMLWAARHSGKL